MNCPHCGTPAGKWPLKARAQILWANQYGVKRRVICRACNVWTDVTEYRDNRQTIYRVVKGKIRR